MRPKSIKRLLPLGAVAAVALLLSAAPAFAGLTVLPDQHDFGEVRVGSTANISIELSNDWWGDLTIYSVSIMGSSDFALVNPPPSGTVVPPGSSLHMGVSFTASAEGLATAVLEVQWSNGESGTAIVDLDGSGSGNSAEGRLGALRNMIAAAGDYIDQGEYALGVAQLEAVLARCDGDSRPPDFVEGDAAAELHGMVEEVIAALEG